MSLQRHVVWKIRSALVLFGALSVAGAANSAPRPVNDATAFAAQTTSPFALADFDGDNELDIATVQVGQLGSSQTRYWIDFRLSTGLRQSIGVTAPVGGLHIAPRDVNGDTFLDLIVTTAWQHQPVAVLLNDGRGNFTLHDPTVFSATLWGAQTSWAPHLGHGYDIAAALLPRNLAGRCDAVQRVATHGQQRRIRFALLVSQKAPSFSESVLGRAPPNFVLHV